MIEDVASLLDAAIARAVANPAQRPQLLAVLQGDAKLRGLARQELARLNDGQATGYVLDRCHISKRRHAMLTEMLAQCTQ